MDLLAFEPYFQYFLTIAAVLTVIIGGIRFANKKLEQKISDEIKEATKQINPNTNGGKSLSDLHGKIDKLIEELEKNGRAD